MSRYFAAFGCESHESGAGRDRNSCNRKTDEILKPSLREQILEGLESQIGIHRDNKNVGDERARVCVLIPRWARKRNVERRVAFA